ncbi:cytoplasmic protein [Ephemerocybe angulata]|uniref:Cytoplasmic protein n=1 Tax=Ephemerocybe angulata TaxID=980116 RepID=A0A8H6HXF8_9AGAR|nr:cytoplasmic protein [Tulosesus angulatus]
MAPKSKSIFRQPGAKHFQLVHRSQRDPLINDPEASQHVLKAFVRENDKKGKTRAELEDQLGEEIAANPALEKLGQASLYGVYYDDSAYDYMQHLRPVGVYEDGVDSILIEAPSTSKGKGKKGGNILEIPDEALPSAYELPRTYESQQAVPQSIAGFQPDMDPHLRQALEALEDDAFVDDGLEDDFFSELVGEGERDEEEEFGFEFREDGIPSDAEEEEDHFDEGTEASWEDRFAQFKKTQAAKAAKQENDSDDEFASEGGDTIGTLHTISVIGGKKRRRKGGSDATGYSMSSSSMTRHEGLKTLDERFDQMMLREYENDEEGDEDEEHSDADSDEAPELITSRDDFDSMVDEFLNDYEILGRKLRPKLEGETGAEKLGTFRAAVGLDERVRIQRDGEDDDDTDLLDLVEEEPKDRWDCETILSTYSNLDNHPRLIRARTSKPVPKITLDPRTGLPSIAESNTKPTPKRGLNVRQPLSNSEDTDEYDSDVTTKGHRGAAVGRPRNESAEEKKARKAEIKQQKQSRRVEKKAKQEQFSAEMKGLRKTLPATEIRMKKL